MKIDAHQHFWSLERGDYGWITRDLHVLFRDYGPADLTPLLAEANIAGTVLVQAAPTVAETRWLLALSDQQPFVAGVVGWVDMNHPTEALKHLAEFAHHPKFVGVRPMLQDIENPAWILNPAFGPIFHDLVQADLTFDALVTPIHLPHIARLLDRHPELRVVINHGGKPRIAESHWQPWARELAVLADHRRCFCKLSGLFTEADARQPHQQVLPYMNHLLRVFGVDRLIWGSDWPVLNLNGSYREWRRLCECWANKLPAPARKAIWGGNAVRFYQPRNYGNKRE